MRPADLCVFKEAAHLELKFGAGLGLLGCQFCVFSALSLLLSPEGPRIEKIQSREAVLKEIKLSILNENFQSRNEIFIPGPCLTAEKQGPGLNISIENEIFKPRMKISSENENFVRGGMVFFVFLCV